MHVQSDPNNGVAMRVQFRHRVDSISILSIRSPTRTSSFGTKPAARNTSLLDCGAVRLACGAVKQPVVREGGTRNSRSTTSTAARSLPQRWRHAKQGVPCPKTQEGSAYIVSLTGEGHGHRHTCNHYHSTRRPRNWPRGMSGCCG